MLFTTTIQVVQTGKTSPKVLASNLGLLLLGPMPLLHTHPSFLAETLAAPPDGKRRAGFALQAFTVLNTHQAMNRHVQGLRMTSHTCK